MYEVIRSLGFNKLQLVFCQTFDFSSNYYDLHGIIIYILRRIFFSQCLYDELDYAKTYCDYATYIHLILYIDYIKERLYEIFVWPFQDIKLKTRCNSFDFCNWNTPGTVYCVNVNRQSLITKWKDKLLISFSADNNIIKMLLENNGNVFIIIFILEWSNQCSWTKIKLALLFFVICWNGLWVFSIVQHNFFGIVAVSLLVGQMGFGKLIGNM
jgi:hypothetical protein